MSGHDLAREPGLGEQRAEGLPVRYRVEPG